MLAKNIDKNVMTTDSAHKITPECPSHMSLYSRLRIETKHKAALYMTINAWECESLLNNRSDAQILALRVNHIFSMFIIVSNRVGLCNIGNFKRLSVYKKCTR